MIKVINNIEYTKDHDDKFWTASPNGIDPGIICECGNAEFTLIYGNWEISAKCTKCGLKDSVYSG